MEKTKEGSSMPVIQAHRGASGYAPENTLPAFLLAVRQGADGVETDIHMTKDGHFVLCHDEEIARTSNGTGKIREMTLEQLRAYDFGGYRSTEYEGTPIPTLEEFLEVVKGLDPINIEIKGPFPEGTDMDAVYRRLYELLDAYGCVEKALFSSFQHSWLRELKERFPMLRTGLLYAGDPKTPEETLRLAREYQADAVHPALHSIDREIVEACRKNGVDVNVWTVDSPEDIALAVSLGVTGIITDVPDRVRAYCEEFA